MWRTDSLEKTLMLGKSEGRRRRGRYRRRKGMIEDEMVGWHHRLDGHEFEQALGVGDGLGSLACWGPWGHKELDMTERLNWTLIFSQIFNSISVKIKIKRSFMWKCFVSCNIVKYSPVFSNCVIFKNHHGEILIHQLWILILHFE